MFSTLFQVCACEQGFELESTGRVCMEVDECREPGGRPCSQTCVNTEGSYSCTCHPGYALEPDGHTCKAAGTVELGTSPQPWVARFKVLNLPMRVSLSWSSVLQPALSVFRASLAEPQSTVFIICTEFESEQVY